jgi:hypothetical protein
MEGIIVYVGIVVFIIIILLFISIYWGKDSLLGHREGFCNLGDKALQISGDYSKCQRVWNTRDYCTNEDCGRENRYIDNNRLSDL